MQAHQRPKIEDYEQGYFLVLHTACYDDEREEVRFGEVHVFTGRELRRRRAPRRGHRAAVRARVARAASATSCRSGPAAAVWAVMDKVVDDYAPVLEGIENDVEEVEEAVFETAGDETRRVYFLRRELAEFYRAVHPLLIGARRARVEHARRHPDAPARPPARRRGPRPPRRGGDRHPARRADERLPGQPRGHRPAAERGRAQDLRLGGDHRRADVHGEHLGHELQAHARAVVARRLRDSRSRRCCSSGAALFRVLRRAGWL